MKHMIEKINKYIVQSAVLRLQLPLLFKQRKYKELLATVVEDDCSKG